MLKLGKGAITQYILTPDQLVASSEANSANNRNRQKHLVLGRSQQRGLAKQAPSHPRADVDQEAETAELEAEQYEQETTKEETVVIKQEPTAKHGM